VALSQSTLAPWFLPPPPCILCNCVGCKGVAPLSTIKRVIYPIPLKKKMTTKLYIYLKTRPINQIPFFSNFFFFHYFHFHNLVFVRKRKTHIAIFLICFFLPVVGGMSLNIALEAKSFLFSA